MDDRLDKVIRSETWPRGEATNAFFPQVHHFFQEHGILGRTLSVEHGGNTYRISCSEHTFMVYRVNKHHAVSPGIPGWPVCIIDTRLQECKTQRVQEQHLCSGLELEDWLEMVRRHCK